jgi:type IV secretion system protein VirD4
VNKGHFHRLRLVLFIPYHALCHTILVILTTDEVLRLPVDKALVVMRGQKILQADKYDYANHPEAGKLIPVKASAYIPDRPDTAEPEEWINQPRPTPRKRPKAPAAEGGARVVTADKDSIMSKQNLTGGS